MRVHNDPYDVQFGQGQWTVAMGRVSGTFTKPMQTPDGETIALTGKRFETVFTTIAKWKNDQIVKVCSGWLVHIPHEGAHKAQQPAGLGEL